MKETFIRALNSKARTKRGRYRNAHFILSLLMGSSGLSATDNKTRQMVEYWMGLLKDAP